MIKGVAIVGSPPPRKKNGISIIELREAFAALWIKPGSLSSDIAHQGRFNGWSETDQFFFASITALVGDICLVGIFCFPVPAGSHSEHFAEPGSSLTQNHEDEAISLG